MNPDHERQIDALPDEARAYFVEKITKKLRAIEYLVANDKYRNEWQGAGMWEALLTVMGNNMEWTIEELDKLLKRAEDF